MIRDRPPLVKYYLPLYLWMAIIFAVSSIPSAFLPQFRFDMADAIAHTVEYLILGLFLIRALRHSGFGRMPGARLAFLSVALGALYAVSDEVHQYFVPGRYMEMPDIFFDLVGLTIGVLAYQISKGKRL